MNGKKVGSATILVLVALAAAGTALALGTGDAQAVYCAGEYNSATGGCDGYYTADNGLHCIGIWTGTSCTGV